MDKTKVIRTVTLIKSLGFYNKKFKKKKEFTIPLTSNGLILLTHVKPVANGIDITGVTEIKEILYIDEEVEHGLLDGDIAVFLQMEIGGELSFLIHTRRKMRMLIYEKIDNRRARLKKIKKLKEGTIKKTS
ncbi:hypothetical protein FKG96_22280 [Olivibacter sp. LS-1]|uniref:hypothetical protein n=1 Tax=Olivibacter sp. LS-1 TaxID=2592345 RepID=UPI0011EAF26D|nr:hypothetical protein [Olivibacter sp. LS-1]QEL03440.1 hypothetical protein FKG96_22280 [Olivibacter sp. LS-1]